MRQIDTLSVTSRKQRHSEGAGAYICIYVRSGVQKHCIVKCIRIKNEMGYVCSMQGTDQTHITLVGNYSGRRSLQRTWNTPENDN